MNQNAIHIPNKNEYYQRIFGVVQEYEWFKIVPGRAIECLEATRAALVNKSREISREHVLIRDIRKSDTTARYCVP